MLPCANDQAIGPVSSCRSFDFTLAFESYVLSILPSALLLVLGVLRLWQLRNAAYRLPGLGRSPRLAKVFYATKILTAGSLGATSFAAMAVWADKTDGFSSPSLTAAAALAFLSSIIGVFLCHREHFVTTQSSLLLPFYLLSTILCDAVRLRSFALSGFIHTVRDGRFFAAFCATFAVRCAWFVTENLDKAWILRETMGAGTPLAAESTATFVSRIFFAWATPLLIRGARTQLTLENLDPISEDLDSLALWEHGRLQWEKEIAGGGKHPLLWTLIRAFPSAVFAPILPCIIYSLAMIARPQAIQDAIQFVDSYTIDGATPEPVANGWGLAAGFFGIYAVYGVAYSWWFLSCNRGASMLRGFLLQAIYRKALRLHVEKAKETGSAKTGSMMSIETEKILLRFQNFYEPLSALIIILLGLVLLYKQIGASFVAAIICIVSMAVSTPLLAKGVGPAQVVWTTLTDRRTKLTSSVLRNIIPVKLSAYTLPLGKKIMALRDSEVVACTSYWFQILKLSVLTNTAANLISLITLGTYAVVTILDTTAPPLSTARMFTVVAILGTIVQPLFSLGQGWASIVGAWTSVQRIERFLLAEEKTDSSTGDSTADVKAHLDIVFANASFGRGDDRFLHELSTTIPHGKITFVIGRVGCGKSTFLQACLREVDLQGGAFNVPSEPTAFCSQDSWLRSESIRDAIVFASKYDEAWYRRVVRAVSLERDFEILPDGDLTIATRTSGGQRQRIALARAVYSRANRLILDDVFSALDANTEGSVFSALFDPAHGLLAGKTVILVTHGVHRLAQADHLIVLAHGRIVEQGSYAELMAAQGLMCDLVRDFASQRHTNAETSAFEQDEEKEESKENKNAQASRDDEGGRGATPWSVYGFYFAAVGPWRVLIAALLTVACSVLPLVVNIYQNYWSASIVISPRAGLRRFFGGYVALELFYVLVFSLGVWYIFCVASPNASERLHRSLLTSVLAAPIVKLEKGGVGRLLNRFSSDIFEVDFALPNSILNVSFLVLQVLGSVILICISAPWVGLVILGVAVTFVIIQRFYTRTSQQLRRLDLGSKTPLYDLLTDVVNADGIRTVRAFQCEQYFTNLNTRFVEASQRPYYLMNVTRRWMNSVVNWAVAIINAGLVLLAVVLRNSTSAGIFAVALVQATLMTNSLNYLLLSWVEAEICIVAVERIKEFSDLAPEEMLDVKDDFLYDPEGKEAKALREVWPLRGGIMFNNVSARYDQGLEPVLKNLSFKIRAGDRVGIVGRTGSGKSTTLAVLFRMLEVDDGGKIFVDGKDIKELPLETLRQGLTLIPQDPLLLEMSVRDNLDLEGQSTDAEIWAALEKSSMKAVIEALPLKLDEIVTGSGHFSRGQKQLLALARALLRNRRIVCLDEATSSLDVETDQAIQRTLRSSFGDATIVTIAHRIATIQDYDQILVLDDGRLAEHGSPAELLKKERGLFRALVRGDEAVSLTSFEDIRPTP